jgi:hypothetical protein
MKRRILLSAACLITASFATLPALAAGEHSMTGCLAKEGDAYALTDVEGAVKHVAIADSSADLAGHVGHKVEITGTTVAGKDEKTHTMKVTAMKHIAATCQ